MNQPVQTTWLDDLAVSVAQPAEQWNWPPHPIPYQGSKRALAPTILAAIGPRRFHRLYEPFAGSAAITLASAQLGVADRYLISDSLYPLAGIWDQIIRQPEALAAGYERIWQECPQSERRIDYYNQVRSQYNTDKDPVKLLYLVCRCTKNAVRFNRQSNFNQAPDPRRYGMRPATMRNEILNAHYLLAKHATAACADFEDAITEAGPEDLVYMDPPYMGVTNGHHKRYHQGLARERLIAVLEDLIRRGVPYVLSYDGRTGDRTYGEALPSELGRRLELHAGRSSQETLNGRQLDTVESLYISWCLT